MRLKFLSVIFFIATIFSIFISCSKESEVATKPVTLDMSGFAQMDPKFNLGRVLFYDKHLSVNASISCASCHKQILAFSDNVVFSRGFENRLTLRNSLPIQNIMNNNFLPQNLFWDGRETELTTMVLKPVLNHVEMGMGDQNDIVQRVSNYPYYVDLFQSAFGSTEINAENISIALASFISGITSENTKFDKAMMGQVQLSGTEESGRLLFINKYNCNGCHKVESPGFYGTAQENAFVNIGLDADYIDNGRFNATNDPADRGKFKVPDLRNVALTGPYMHDGRYTTLDQVLEHYSHGIANHPNLDPRLKDLHGNAAEMNISDQEKTAIIAFLNTLTDYTMITDKNLADPFVQ